MMLAIYGVYFKTLLNLLSM